MMDQPAPRKRPSIIWPLILITAGVIFLLDNLNIIPGTLWDLLARYWPVLLILLSLESLIRGDSFFGPVFTIGAAVVFQLSILGTIEWSVWEIILRFWPVMIIVAGLDILLGHGQRRSIPAMLLGLLLVVAIVAGIIWYTGFGRGSISEQAAHTETIDVQLDNSSSAEIDISAPMAVLTLGPGAPAQKLAVGSIGLGKNISLKQSYEIQDRQGNLSISTSNFSSFAPGLDRAGAVWDIRLNESVPMEITVASVFSQSTINLSKFVLDALKIENVFSTVTFVVPSADTVNGDIDTVFSTLTIQVPEGTSISINYDGFFHSFDLPIGYTKIDQVVLSPGAVEGQADINLNMDNVFSTVKIVAVP